MLLLEDYNDLAAMVQESGAATLPTPSGAVARVGGLVPLAREWCDDLTRERDDGSASFDRAWSG